VGIGLSIDSLAGPLIAELLMMMTTAMVMAMKMIPRGKILQELWSLESGAERHCFSIHFSRGRSR
jgi:hypothetical protein